jgi:hypothetical protein
LSAHWDSVIRVADLFHPLHNRSIQVFLNGKMRHPAVRRGSVPVLLTGWDRHHVTGANLLHRGAPALYASDPCNDDQHLAARVSRLNTWNYGKERKGL